MESARESSPRQPKGNGSFNRGCGCLLLAVGVMLAVCAIIIGVTGVVLDVEGGNKNEAEWAEYEKNLPVIDSLYDAGVPDSIIGELYPQPIIRQGGFATIFGGAFAFLILIVALIPIIIGVVMLRRHKKRSKERELEM